MTILETNPTQFVFVSFFREKLRSPRVLTCLHVFCEDCIDVMLNEARDDLLDDNNTIECPECHQATTVHGVAETLPPHYVMTNILDLVSLEPGALQCTSCKSAETAISRCNDCAHFLCGACDNAHKYMRCFENHKVVILDDLRQSDEKVAIHKPIFCAMHASENVKYYCFKCQQPICNDCVIGEHKGSEHHYELIGDAEKLMRNDMEELMNNAKSKLSYCDDASTVLGNTLTELQSQHDAAYKSISDTYKRCKAILDECHDQSLKDLERLHSERELKIMDLMHNVEKCVEKTETACKFTNKMLEVANATEMACMKQAITTQFLQLIANTPNVDVNFSIEFMPKVANLERMTQDAFGRFRTESTAPSPKETTPPPTLPGLPPTLKPNISCSGSSQSAMSSSVTASSPISLPASMQSSFDGDLQNIGTERFMMPPSALTPDAVPAQQSNLSNGLHSNGSGSSLNAANMNAQNGNLQSQLSIAEINLRRLANLVESSDMPDGIGSARQPSPASFTLADLISNERAFSNNLEALYKLGFNNGKDFKTGFFFVWCR